MMCKSYLIGPLLLIAVHLGPINAFTIGPVQLELFDDKFRLSIPNDPEIKWVAFNVNFNKEFLSFEAGQLSGFEREAKDQKWAHDFHRYLTSTDQLYVWMAVLHNTVVDNYKMGPFSVGDLRRRNSKYPIPSSSTSTASISSTSTSTSTSTTTTTTTPKPETASNKQCLASVTEVDGGNKKHCKGDLLFEDNFDLFDTHRWTNEVRLPPNTEDAEFVLYNGTAYVDSGKLKIPATVYEGSIFNGRIDLGNRCTGIRKECSLVAKPYLYLPPVISGRINSKKSFNFKYGRIEVKAKMAKGDWLVPLILLEPKIKKYGEEDYQSGEMRIGFTRGNLNLKLNNIKIDGTRLFGGALLSQDANLRHQFMANATLDDVAGTETEHFGNKFHVYSLIWKPNELLLSVDNYQYGKIKTDFKKSVDVPDWRLGGEDAPLDRMFYLTLGLSVGGHGDFPEGLENKPWINTAPKAIKEFSKKHSEWNPTWEKPSLEVDYVRVYAV